MPPTPHAFFLDSRSPQTGRRFCIHLAPTPVPARAALVFVHALGEEMNKSRRMVAMQSRALAAAGFAVLSIDLFGCGDSDGDFGDATWPQWHDDVLDACGWMQAQHQAPLCLWGHRTGCILAAEVASGLPECQSLLFWQPQTAGKQALQGLLRLKAAAGMLGGAPSVSTADLRRQLSEGSAIDVGGYTLSPALARGLEGAVLTAPPQPCHTEWVEVSTDPSLAPTPAAKQAVERWRRPDASVRLQVVAGSSFWQSTELEDVPALLDASTRALCSLFAPDAGGGARPC